MAGIPPPPPLPPGTVVPQSRLPPPPMRTGVPVGLTAASPVAAPLPPATTASIGTASSYGNGNAQGSLTVSGGTIAPPPPPPLPPGTIIPQNRPVPPAMPAGALPVGLPAVVGSTSISAGVPVPRRKVFERPAQASSVEFPDKVSYFECGDDLDGDKEKGILSLRTGQMVVVYKANDPHWWLGKVGDEVGWIASHCLQEIDPQAAGRQAHHGGEEANPRTWDSKKYGAMSAAELDMDKTDFGMTQATTFDHRGSKITAFFIQVSGVRKSVKKQGDIWVVAKTLKAFNRLRVAWEEDYGTASIPVEPPPARWADCSEPDWNTVKGAALRKFLEEVKQWPNLKHSQDLKHFLTTDRVNLSGGRIDNETMKPYLDAWVKTSSEPSWTQPLPTIPSKADGEGVAGKPAPKANGDKKVPIPGLRAGDETFGQLTSRRPKLRRSGVFGQISALAAVTRQEAQLEAGRRGWTEAGIKLNLLSRGCDASSLKRRSERNIYQKYYADEGVEDEYGKGGFAGQDRPARSKALMQRGSYNQMKFQMRYNLERVMYGRMESLGKENITKYAVYAKKKEQEKLEKDGGVLGNDKRVMEDGGPSGNDKKHTMFLLESLSERLDKITRVNETQTSKDAALDRCQYMSKVRGRFTMPISAQLMALDELTQEDLDHFLSHMGESNRPKLERMKEVDSFFEYKRVRCHQLVTLLDRMHTADERLLVVLTCCAKLTDAVEADDQGLFSDLEGAIDPLNLKRARLAVDVLVAEAQAEDASRASRKAAREVFADVQRARKALGFLSKAVEKIRSGTIKADMFGQLKERLEAAADAAHEEYCDAVKDAKPANEYAEQATLLMESTEKLFRDLDELGTGVRDRIKVVHNSSSGSLGNVLGPADTEESILVSALEVLLTIASNAHELSSRAADNARFDMQTALEEVAKAEKIIRRVELEERRARNECDVAEGKDDHESIVPPGCPFGEWAEDMKAMAVANLEKFRKDGKYRLHLDKAVFRGTEDMLMMTTMVSKVQLLRDLKILKTEAKNEEEKRQDSLMQSNSKRRRRSSARRDSAAATASGATTTARHAPLRQQSSLGGAPAPTTRRAPLRQQSSLGPSEAAEETMARKERARKRTVAFSKEGKNRPMGELEDNLEEEDENAEDSNDENGVGKAGGSGRSEGGESGGEESSTSSSEADSVFGSDLDADDDDLGELRKKAAGRRINGTRRRNRESVASRPGGAGGEANGSVVSAPGRRSLAGRASTAEDATRRNDKMRRELIQQTLGKRRSIGTKALAKTLAPSTPRHGTGRSSSRFTFDQPGQQQD